MKTTILPLATLMNRSPFRAFLIIPFVAACFALSARLQATCQDACLTNDNTVQGDDALISLTTGTDNTAIGFNALFSNTTGYQNTATGSDALYSNTLGYGNTAIGFEALFSNTTGYGNAAIGFEALSSNTTGSYNTGIGDIALSHNTTGLGNTASGYLALYLNTTGYGNTASGVAALSHNVTGGANTANGVSALAFNTEGNNNTADGISALVNNTTGNSNTAIGRQALLSNTTGSNNIGLGLGAGRNLTSGDSNIDIGNVGVAAESDTIRIGTRGIETATFIAGISGVTVPGGVAVIVDNNGQLGTVVSSERFKDEIRPMDKVSEAILALNPVTFRYKHELDPERIPQFGLVAEQVEKVNPDLVARDGQGKPYTVRYEAVNAMLLNEFLKEHGKVEKLEATVAQQQKALQAAIGALKQTVTTQLNQQAAEIQKLTTRLETSKPLLQTIANNQ
jgi:Chaperone of endosialidase